MQLLSVMIKYISKLSFSLITGEVDNSETHAPRPLQSYTGWAWRQTL